MPYHIGEKGSNGCSGYPVVSDKGHVAGCHATEAEATNQLQALYANVKDATKALDTELIPNGADEAGCTADSPDCGDDMCKMCAKKMFSNLGKDYTKAIRTTYQA